MKKLLALLLALVLTLSFTACGGTSAPQTEAPGNNAEIPAKTYSQDEVVQAAKDIYAKLNETAVQKDFDAFADLYVNTSEDVVKSEYDNIRDYRQYDQHFTVYVGNEGGYYLVSHVDAISSGVYPNTSVSRSWRMSIITPAEDGWKLDFSVQAQEAVKTALMAAMPQGMQDAQNAGRNITFFNYGNFMQLDTGLYVDGILDANIMNLWQDEEGNLCIGVLINNGTDGNRAISSMSIKLEDSALGTVFEGELGTENILEGSSKYVVFTVPAAQVQSGTAAWSSMSYSMNTRSV